MATLEVLAGPHLGPSETVFVSDQTQRQAWPLIDGRGGPGTPSHMIGLAIMDGGVHFPPDPRLAGWPADFVGILRAVAAGDPTGMVYTAALVPSPGIIQVLCLPLGDPNINRVDHISFTLRAAGHEVRR